MKQKLKKQKKKPVTFTDLEECGSTVERIRKIRQEIAVVLKNIESLINKKLPVEQINKLVSDKFPEAKFLLFEFQRAINKQISLKKFEGQLTEMSTLNGFKSDFRRSNRSVRKSTLIRIEKLKSISGMDQGFMSDEIGRFYFSLFFNKFFIEDFFPWQFSLNNSFQKKTYIFS